MRTCVKQQDRTVKETSTCFPLLSRLLPLRLLHGLFSTSLFLLIGVISGTCQLTSSLLNCSNEQALKPLESIKCCTGSTFWLGYLALTHVSSLFVGPAPVTSQSPVPCKLCIFSKGLGRAGEGSCHFSLHRGLRVVQDPGSGESHHGNHPWGFPLIEGWASMGASVRGGKDAHGTWVASCPPLLG